MKKVYRLIKEYPGSEKLGTTFTFDEGWNCYRVGNRFKTIWVEDYFKPWIGVYFEVI